MKKRRLKGFVVPVFSAIMFSIVLMAIMTFNVKTEDVVDNEEYTYVNETIINDAIPVLSEEDVIIRPYQAEKIDIYKKFYDEKGNEDSIIYYKDTYIQNSGILYNSENEFNVVSILDGEITEVKKDDLLGYVVEIKHDNNLISSYEGLKTVNVKKGEKINQNTIIGKSGEINLDKKLSNALLFELIKDGKYVNPEEYYDKKVKEV